MTSYRLKAYGYLLLVSLLWGAATPVIKFTLGGIAPMSFLLYRFFISAVIGVIFFLFVKTNFSAIKRNFSMTTVYSLVTTTFALGLLFLGLNKTTVLDTVLITAISPLVTVIAGSLFLNERVTNQEKLGIFIALTGTLVTILEPIFKGAVELSQVTGNLLVFGYLIANGLSAVLSKKLVRKGIDPLDLSNFSFILGFIAILPLVPFETSFPDVISKITTLSLPYHLGVLYMAILSGTIAYALWVKGQKSIEVSEAGVFAYLMPIFATPLAVFWLGETITPYFILGAILITIGVFIAEYKRRRK